LLRGGSFHHLCVDVDFRSQNLASQLVEKVMASFDNEGISLVSLVVMKENEDGNVFWEENGFVTRPDLTYRNKRISTSLHIQATKTSDEINENSMQLYKKEDLK